MPGRLSLPEGPANPGEFDYAALLRDRQISALLSVRDSRDVEVLATAGSHRRGPGWRSCAAGPNTLIGALPEPQGDLAAALLLGDSPGMTTDDWDLYLRTGVIHVLAISGQHLVVLAGFLWLALRLMRVRQRRGAPLSPCCCSSTRWWSALGRRSCGLHGWCLPTAAAYCSSGPPIPPTRSRSPGWVWSW